MNVTLHLRSCTMPCFIDSIQQSFAPPHHCRACGESLWHIFEIVQRCDNSGQRSATSRSN
jgi:hypothetical protein